MAVTVKVNGVDLSTKHRRRGFSIKNSGMQGIAVADVDFVDEAGTETVNLEHVLQILDGATEIFEGPIRHRTRTAVKDPGIAKKVYSVKAQDYTALLADDAIDVALIRTGSRTDKAEVEYLVNTFNLKGITVGATVQNTGTISRDIDYTGMNLYEALEEASKWLGTAFYVDSNLVLHWFVSEVNAAPFNLSDTPNGTTTFGYRELVLEDESVEYCNAVFVIGDGITGWRPSPPPAGATRRAQTLRDTNVTTQAQLDLAGDAFIAAAIVGFPIRLKCFRPGLKAGMTIQLTNALWGLAAVTYRILEVTTSYEGETDQLGYDLVLNSKPPDIGSLLTSQQRQGVSSGIAAQQTEQILLDLQQAGANLVPNSSFEDGSYWVVGSNCVINYDPVPPEEPVHGQKVMRWTPTGSSTTESYTDYIAVNRLKEYWASWSSFIRARTGGSLTARVVQYDAAFAVGTSTDIVLSAVDVDWVRRSLHFGPNTQGGKVAFDAGAKWVRIAFGGTGAANFTADVDAVQFEQSNVLTSYAPSPYELMDGSITSAKLAALSVTLAKIAAGAVDSTKLAALAVTLGKIAPDAVDASAIAALAVGSAELAASAVTLGKIANDAVDSAAIAALAVGSAELAANAVTLGKINAGAVDSTALAALAVTTAKIAADAVTAAEIAASAVGSTELAAGAVIAGKIAALTIVAADIAAGTITGAKIAALTITANEIAAGAIVTAKLAAAAVTATEIASGAITTIKLAAGAVTANEIAALAVTAAKIAANTITAAQIAAGTITATEIASGAITTIKLAAGAVTTNELAALAVTAAKIAAGTITATQIAADTITANEIAANAITASEIAANAVTTAKVNALAIDATKIAANAIVAGKIAAGVVTATELAAGAVTADKLQVGMLPSRNMLRNGGFRNGLTGWTFQNGGAPGGVALMWPTTDTDWTLRDGDVDLWLPGGPYGSTAYMYGTNTASVFDQYIYHTSIPVTPGEYYSFSALVGLHRLTSANILVLFWDNTPAVVGSVQSNSAGPSPSAGQGGASRAGWNYLTLDGYQAPTGSSYATFYIAAHTPNTSGSDWYCFIDQCWMGVGKAARPYDPQEVATLRNANSTTVIDSTGLHVYGGQIDVTDTFGIAGVLTGAGVGGSWSDFIQLGLYNARFLSGGGGVSSTPIPDGRTAMLPYWTSTKAGGLTPYWLVVDTGGCVLCVWSGSTGSETLLSDAVPVRPGGVLSVGASVALIRAAGTLSVAATIFWYKADGSASATASTSAGTLAFTATNGTATDYPLTPVVAPADARSARVRLVVSDSTYNASNAVYIFGVSLVQSFGAKSGTAFPLTPVDNTVFFRTDLDAEFVYNASWWPWSSGQWVSSQRFSARSVDVWGTLTYSASGSPVHRLYLGTHSSNDIQITSVELAFFVVAGGSALSASHSWTVGNLKLQPGGQSVTNTSFVIDSGASNAWRRLVLAANPFSTLSQVVIDIPITKVGTPGALQFAVVVGYRVTV